VTIDDAAGDEFNIGRKSLPASDKLHKVKCLKHWKRFRRLDKPRFLFTFASLSSPALYATSISGKVAREILEDSAKPGDRGE